MPQMPRAWWDHESRRCTKHRPPPWSFGAIQSSWGFRRPTRRAGESVEVAPSGTPARSARAATGQQAWRQAAAGGRGTFIAACHTLPVLHLPIHLWQTQTALCSDPHQKCQWTHCLRPSAAYPGTWDANCKPTLEGPAAMDHPSTWEMPATVAQALSMQHSPKCEVIRDGCVHAVPTSWQRSTRASSGQPFLASPPVIACSPWDYIGCFRYALNERRGLKLASCEHREITAGPGKGKIVGDRKHKAEDGRLRLGGWRPRPRCSPTIWDVCSGLFPARGDRGGTAQVAVSPGPQPAGLGPETERQRPRRRGCAGAACVDAAWCCQCQSWAPQALNRRWRLLPVAPVPTRFL